MEQTEEIWKDINNFEGLYQISTWGRVKSLPKKRGEANLRERILSCIIRNNGYAGVSLCKNKIKKSYSIHRLVAIAFIRNPYNKPQVNHIDGIRSNNHVDNLEWNTQSENMRHAHKTKYFR